MSRVMSESMSEEEAAAAEVDVGQVLEAPEPWEPWETSLCLWSLIIGIAGLVILGVLINIFIL